MEVNPGNDPEGTDMPETWASNVGCIGVALIVAAVLAFVAWLCAFAAWLVFVA